jgi:hypothetical protein
VFVFNYNEAFAVGLGTHHSSGRKVTQLKKYNFSGEAIELFFLIRVFKIEESEAGNTYVGKKGILYT